MAEIRQFEADDVSEVADLWQRCFRRSQSEATQGLAQYFRDIFLGGPWYHPDYRPLVYVIAGGAITGFLGRMHRRMLFRQRPIHCAIATQLMVDPDRKQPFCAFELLRAFHAGPHDLAYSDGANDASRRLWERCGGHSSRLLSMDWQRVLHPAQAFLVRLQDHRSLGPVARALNPCSGVLDTLAVSTMPRLWHKPRARFNAQPADASRLLPVIRRVMDPVSLTPAYAVTELQWILDKAAEAQSFGPLRSRVVSTPGGEDVGWFIYYARAGRVAQVLQVGAVPGQGPAVLASLFRDAWQQGVAAVSGQLDPHLLTDLSDASCTFRCTSMGVLVQSPHGELLSAIDRGDVALSRLDGEWWLRFGVDRNTAW